MKLTLGIHTRFGAGYTVGVMHTDIRHMRGVSLVGIYRAGWQVEVIFNYGLKVVSFVLTTGRPRWYIVRSYVPPNDAPSLARMEQALGRAVKGVEVILLGDLSVRLGETRDAQEEELAPVVANCGLEDMMDHYMPR